MANVLIRNIPEEVLERFKNVARSHKRSLQQELREALENTVNRSTGEICQKALELRKRLRKKPIHFTDSAKLLREDRSR